MRCDAHFISGQGTFDTTYGACPSVYWVRLIPGLFPTIPNDTLLKAWRLETRLARLIKGCLSMPCKVYLMSDECGTIYSCFVRLERTAPSFALVPSGHMYLLALGRIARYQFCATDPADHFCTIAYGCTLVCVQFIDYRVFFTLFY